MRQVGEAGSDIVDRPRDPTSATRSRTPRTRTGSRIGTDSRNSISIAGLLHLIAEIRRTRRCRSRFATRAYAVTPSLLVGS